MRLPDDQCERIFAGEHPLKVWREFRRLEQSELRTGTKISFARVAQIEQGKGKPISREEAKIFGRVLDVAAIELMPHEQAYRGCSGLDVDEDAILAQDEG